MNRYNRTGETEPEKIDSKLRVGFEARARRDKKPVDGKPLKLNRQRLNSSKNVRTGLA